MYIQDPHSSRQPIDSNPNWNEEATNEVLYERLQKAMLLVGQEFHKRVSYYSKVWYPAKKYVKQAVSDRRTVHPSGTIIDLSLNGGLPWKEHLFAVEKEMDIVGEIKFAIFQDLSKDWRVCCVPIFAKSFTLRTPLHIEWRGLMDEKLSQVSDIPDCIFVHATGFIGGARTREACATMTVKTRFSSKGRVERVNIVFSSEALLRELTGGSSILRF